MFNDYANIMIMGICLCVGFVLKKWVKDVSNRLIPTINAVLGFLLSVWMAQWNISPSIILTGMISGLSATGAYEAFRQFIEAGTEMKN